MMEAEQLIIGLRGQVRTLQSMLNYLESRDALERDDYAFCETKLKDIVRSLQGLQEFAAKERGGLRAVWLN